MIPQRRLATLLHQAREYQHSRCVYHNSSLQSSSFSLYTDHHCNKSDFPNTTTTILHGHSDEVWNLQWSHDGSYLATCGKDKTAIIWKITVSRPQTPCNTLVTFFLYRYQQIPLPIGQHTIYYETTNTPSAVSPGPSTMPSSSQVQNSISSSGTPRSVNLPSFVSPPSHVPMPDWRVS